MTVSKILTEQQANEFIEGETSPDASPLFGNSDCFAYDNRKKRVACSTCGHVHGLGSGVCSECSCPKYVFQNEEEELDDVEV